MSATKHIKALDGVRGIAILAVVLCHGGSIIKDVPGSHFLKAGWVGVDLFFVLSGFLITSILLREREQRKYFGNFYFRRAMRIWPLYYIYLFSMAGIAAALPHIHAYQRLVESSAYLRDSPLIIVTPLLVCMLFAQNLWLPSLFSFKDTLISITWSLCIEEQFYLVWPLAVRFVSRKALARSLALLLVLEPALRAILFKLEFDHAAAYEVAYRFPLFRLDSIAAGSLLALVWPRVASHPRTKPVLYGMLAASLPLCWLFFSAEGPLTFTATALLCVSVVGIALSGLGHGVLESRPLTFLGTISYGLYLIHPNILNVFQAKSLYARVGLRGNLNVIELFLFFVAIMLSIGLASLSRFTLEAFFLRIKDRRSKGEMSGILPLEAARKLY